MDILFYVSEKTKELNRKYSKLTKEMCTEIGEAMTIDSKDLEEYGNRQLEMLKQIKKKSDISLQKSHKFFHEEDKLFNDTELFIHEKPNELQMSTTDSHELNTSESIIVKSIEEYKQDTPPKKKMERLDDFEYINVIPKEHQFYHKHDVSLFEKTTTEFIEQVNMLIEQYNEEQQDQKKLKFFVTFTRR